MNKKPHSEALVSSQVMRGDAIVIVKFDEHEKVINAKDNPDRLIVESITPSKRELVASSNLEAARIYSFEELGLPETPTGDVWSLHCVMRYGVARNVMRSALGTTSTSVNRGFSVDRDMMLLVGGPSTRSLATA